MTGAGGLGGGGKDVWIYFVSGVEERQITWIVKVEVEGGSLGEEWLKLICRFWGGFAADSFVLADVIGRFINLAVVRHL